MRRYKRHGQERSKQHCSRCGREGIIDTAGLCKRCRRAVRTPSQPVEETAHD